MYQADLTDEVYQQKDIEKSTQELAMLLPKLCYWSDPTKRATYITLGIKEAPSSLFKKCFGIINNRFKNFSPIERLNTIGISNITRAKKQNDNARW